MEITKTKTEESIPFGNLKIGDMFVAKDCVYMKIRTTNAGQNAVCLDSGELTFLRNDNFLKKVKSVEVEY